MEQDFHRNIEHAIDLHGCCCCFAVLSRVAEGSTADTGHSSSVEAAGSPFNVHIRMKIVNLSQWTLGEPRVFTTGGDAPSSLGPIAPDSCAAGTLGTAGQCKPHKFLLKVKLVMQGANDPCAHHLCFLQA